MTLGEIIRDYRRQNGISQREFARLVGISQATVCDAERDVYSQTNKSKIIKFLNIEKSSLDTTSEEIVGIYIKAAREYLQFTQFDMVELIHGSTNKILSLVENGSFYVKSYDIFPILRSILELFKDNFLYTNEFKEALNNLKGKIGNDHSIYNYHKFVEKSDIYKLSFKKWVILHKIRYPKICEKYYISKSIYTVIYADNDCIYSDISLKIAYEFNFRNIKSKFNSYEEMIFYVSDRFKKVSNLLIQFKDGTLMEISKKLAISNSVLQKILSKGVNLNYLSINALCKFVLYKKNNIMQNDDIMNIINDLKFMLYDYMPDFYDESKSQNRIEQVVEPKSIEIETEEPIKETSEKTSNNISKIMEVRDAMQDKIAVMDEAIQEINNIREKTKEIIINPFEGIADSSVNKIKEDIFDYIFRLLESDIEKAEDYIKFVENLNLFSTEILRIKLDSKITK